MDNQFTESYFIAKFQAIENASAKEAIEMMYNKDALAGAHLKNLSNFHEGKLEALYELTREIWESNVPREVVRAYWHASEVLMHIGGINLGIIVDAEEED